MLPAQPLDAPLSLWEGVAAVGVLMMHADEDLASEEQEALVRFLVGQGVDPPAAQAAIHKVLQMCQETGQAALEAAAYTAVAGTPQADTALRLAVRIALADGFVLLEENAALLNLVRGLGVSESRLEQIIQEELRQDERFRSLLEE
ncbi:MAG: TerB family tellurite resistance protein [Gloeomargarita sp. SKYB31]|nr:TerB family tellurite resistance protein [Gloeomargarita sp. SKYB31]